MSEMVDKSEVKIEKEKEKEKEKEEDLPQRYSEICDTCGGFIGVPKCDYCGNEIDKYCDFDSVNDLISCCPSETECMKELKKLYKNTQFNDEDICYCEKVYLVPGECRC